MYNNTNKLQRGKVYARISARINKKIKNKE